MLTKKLAQLYKNIKINCCHPGEVATNLYRHNWITEFAMSTIAKYFLKSAKEGALTSLMLALDPDVLGSGKYYAHETEMGVSEAAESSAEASKLYDLSLKFL